MTSTIANSPETWPPHYRIRRSKRARRVFLQFTDKHSLEVVIPETKRNINIEAVLNEHRSWIEKNIKTTPLVKPNTSYWPSTLVCRAIPEVWQIRYEPTVKSKRISLFERTDTEKQLILVGNTQELTLCQKTLAQWVFTHAKQYLIPWLKHLSISTELYYHHANVRRQQTLWGSCNEKKHISLNYKLIFLPRSLAQHVLLHELCHLEHLNHSKRFWSLLKKLDPQSHDNKNALKTADRYLPPWLGTS